MDGPALIPARVPVIPPATAHAGIRARRAKVLVIPPVGARHARVPVIPHVGLTRVSVRAKGIPAGLPVIRSVLNPFFLFLYLFTLFYILENTKGYADGRFVKI